MSNLVNSELQLDRADGPSRRSFFGSSLAGGIGAVAGAMLASVSPNTAEAQRVRPGSFQEPAKFVEVRDHEREHVDTIIMLIESLGGTPRPRPTFRNLAQSSFNNFVATSRILENVGVGAYFGAVPSITDPMVVMASASVALIEARHAGYFNVLAGFAITDGAADPEDGSVAPDVRDSQTFETPLTAQQVGAAASPFIASLNGGPPVDYGTGTTNINVEILNFALALEYLERDFYDINVNRFFGV